MNKDLKIIKKYYGEKMMHLCRELFPTLLEEEGLLSELMIDNFYPSKFLYDDIIESKNINDFKDYIYNLIGYKQIKGEIIKNHPKELLSQVGYDFFECETEEDIQKFKKYYAPGEELCTFRGNRLNYCYVFFAVKKNVDEIKRENFDNPQRQDEYGTSVISIQFTKGDVNTLSIKNRYNHTVSNPDATFSNNLENIIEGLTDSFEKEYNLNINQNVHNSFELPGYVLASDGKFYKYNYEINNICYCPNNIIIDRFEAKKYPKEKYIILDYFILDLVNKKIELYDKYFPEVFSKLITNITKIDIINLKGTENKRIELTIFDSSNVIIEIDKYNRIIGYKNNNLTHIEYPFLHKNKVLENLELLNLKEIGDHFLVENEGLTNLELPQVEMIGNYFMRQNKELEKISIPKVKKIGEDFLCSNEALKRLDALELEKVDKYFLLSNIEMEYINVPKLKQVGHGFLISNENLSYFEAPELVKIGNRFLEKNVILSYLNLPKVETIGYDFLRDNKELTTLKLPKVEYIDSRFLFDNNNLKILVLPEVKVISSDFLYYNNCLKQLVIPKLEVVGSSFLHHNYALKYLEAPMLREIENNFIGWNERLKRIYAPNLEFLDKHFYKFRIVDDINKLYNTPIKKIEKKINNLQCKILREYQNKCLTKKK